MFSTKKEKAKVKQEFESDFSNQNPPNDNPNSLNEEFYVVNLLSKFKPNK